MLRCLLVRTTGAVWCWDPRHPGRNARGPIFPVLSCINRLSALVKTLCFFREPLVKSGHSSAILDRPLLPRLALCALALSSSLFHLAFQSLAGASLLGPAPTHSLAHCALPLSLYHAPFRPLGLLPLLLKAAATLLQDCLIRASFPVAWRRASSLPAFCSGTGPRVARRSLLGLRSN